MSDRYALLGSFSGGLQVGTELEYNGFFKLCRINCLQLICARRVARTIRIRSVPGLVNTHTTVLYMQKLDCAISGVVAYNSDLDFELLDPFGR